MHLRFPENESVPLPSAKTPTHLQFYNTRMTDEEQLSDESDEEIDDGKCFCLYTPALHWADSTMEEMFNVCHGSTDWMRLTDFVLCYHHLTNNGNSWETNSNYVLNAVRAVPEPQLRVCLFTQMGHHRVFVSETRHDDGKCQGRQC